MIATTENVYGYSNWNEQKETGFTSAALVRMGFQYAVLCIVQPYCLTQSLSMWFHSAASECRAQITITSMCIYCINKNYSFVKTALFWCLRVPAITGHMSSVSTHLEA